MMKKTVNTPENTAGQRKKRSQLAEVWKRLRKNKGAVIGMCVILLIILIALSSNIIFDYEVDVIGQNVKERLQTPSLAHPFGTDDLGRDLMARVCYGAQYSLSIGFVAVVVSLLIGVTLGSIAGFYGGMIDNIIMRIADIFISLPSIMLSMAIIAVWGQSMFHLMVAVGICSAAAFTRVARASVMTERSRDYVESARAIGATNFQIIFTHVLPNSLAPIIVQATMRVASAIVSASSLSFLGLGVPVPKPEWGTMLSASRRFLRDYSYMTLFPGLAIMVTVLAFNLFGDGLRDSIDPKLKR